MIDVQHLSFTYNRAARPAIDDISFHIAPGEIFGLLGPSGAGKSTTQNILIGLLRGYSGTATVAGRDLRTWGASYYEQIGVAFELPTHYLKLTALENLRYFGALYSGPTEHPQAMLDLVGLGADASKRVSAFSKGMRNRLSIARALLHRPKLLFLDEPTSGLDPVNAQQIKQVIQQQRDAGVTILLTTHAMQIAEQLCDRVAFMVDGAIALIDSPRALKLRHGRQIVQVEYGANGQRARADYPLAQLGHNAAFLDLLRGEAVQTIHSQETTLEDIFITVTGRSAQ